MASNEIMLAVDLMALLISQWQNHSMLTMSISNGAILSYRKCKRKCKIIYYLFCPRTFAILFILQFWLRAQGTRRTVWIKWNLTEFISIVIFKLKKIFSTIQKLAKKFRQKFKFIYEMKMLIPADECTVNNVDDLSQILK